jgi:Skp family chaperone for outer membrane proteins
MSIRAKTSALTAATVCLVVFGLGSHAAAEISDDDFTALKQQVQQLSDKVQKLEQVHEQDQQAHQQDQEKIQQLEQQLGKTQQTAADAQEKAKTAARMQRKVEQLQEQVSETQKTAAEGKGAVGAQVQPVAPVPEGPLALHNFSIVGDAEVQFGKTYGSHSAFTLADFAPIFLFRANDNILFEAGFDVRLQNGAVTLANGNTGNSGTTTSIDLSFATLDYMLNDYMTIVAGDMLLPLGTYSERSAGWLNKIPDDPLPRAVLPGTGIGAQLRGGIPIGQNGQQLNYSFYVANGPGSVDGTGNSTFTDSSGNVLPNLDFGNVGIQSNGNTGNEHSSPGGGGRIGWFFPLKPHYDIELGISGQTGPWNNGGNKYWSAAVFDGALHVSPFFELKGEYINTWWNTTDRGTLNPRGWWIQGAYKLAGLNLNFPFVNNLELVSRYDQVYDGLGSRTRRETVGYVYYLTNTLLFEGDYEWLQSRGPSLVPSGKWVFQLSYGF